MAETVETKVKVSADATGLKKLGKEAQAAFKPMSVRDMRKEAKQLQTDLAKLTTQQIRLGKEMLKLRQGTKEWKALRTEIRTTRGQAEAVRGVLGDIDRITRRGGRGWQQRQSFFAGFIQGTGLTQYMPIGRGMGARAVGAGLGYMLRRGARGLAAPFQSPGVGGFAGLMQAIPFVGGAASSALMAGYGYFQQAVAFDRARLQNLPYVPNLEARAQQAAPLWAQHERAMRDVRRIRRGKLTRAELERVRKSGRALEEVFTVPLTEPQKMTSAHIPALSAFAKLDPYEQVKTIALAQAATPVTTAYGLLHKLLPGTTMINRTLFAGAKGLGSPVPQGLQRAMQAPAAGLDQPILRRAMIEGVVQGAGRQILEKETGKRAATLAGRAAKAFGVEGILGPGAGVRFGYTPVETQQRLGGFMAARGGALTRAAAPEFVESMAMGRRFGVAPQLAGGYARMFMPGGGGTAGPGTMLTQTLATALVQSLEGSQVVEYLQTLVQLGQEAEQQGVKLNTTWFTGSAMMLHAIGMKGLQAQRMAGGIQRRAREVGLGGVQGPMDLLLARAAGYTPEGGPEAYAMARRQLQQGLNPQQMEALLGEIVTGAKAGGWGPQVTSMFTAQAMTAAGAPIGMEMADRLISGFTESGQLNDKTRAELRGMLDDLSKKYKPGQMITAAAGGARAIGGLGIYAATSEAEQIGMGKRLSGTYINLEKVGRSAVGTLTAFSVSLKAASGIVLEAFKKIETYANRLGPLGPKR